MLCDRCLHRYANMLGESANLEKSIFFSIQFGVLEVTVTGECRCGWCKGSVFEEDHAHGVRKLVTNPKLLSYIE